MSQQLTATYTYLIAFQSLPVTMPSIVDDLAAEPPTDINPYEALGLEISASGEDIKKTYKKLALKHHPGMRLHGTYSEIFRRSQKRR